MKLTSQQKKIVNSTGDIKINAVAGSGKTSTLLEYAKKRPSERILYLAFNKSVKLEAIEKFKEAGLSNVQVETAHSLAYKHVVYRRGYQIAKNGYTPHRIAEILSLQNSGEHLMEFILGNHIGKFASYFCNSAATKVQDLNYLNIVTDAKAIGFVSKNYKTIEHQTRVFLAKMNSGEIEISHDFYLKKFQLSRPRLPYDIILFDEGQDASPTMLAVFLAQDATKVIVGDTHQQIYGWRHAVNSLNKVKFKEYSLTKSFRFRQQIADLAMEVLDWKGIISDFEGVEIIGNGKSNAKKSKAILARTNLGLLLKAIEYVDQNEVSSLYFEGNINSYTYADEGASLYDVLNLYNDKRDKIRDKMIKKMRSMADLEEYVEQTEEMQLGLMIEIVKKYGNDIYDILREIKEKHIDGDQKDKAEMIFSTVHRCKGMEYDSVRLVNDFVSEELLENITNDPKQEVDLAKLIEEINLLYVAITRTKNELYIPENLIPASFEKSKGIIVTKEQNPKKALEEEKIQEKISLSEAKAKAYSVTEMRKTYKAAYKKWTEDEDNKLTVLYCEGYLVSEIAKEMGRSRGSIQHRIEKLRLYDIYD